MNQTTSTDLRWTLAERCRRMNPSTIREILKLTEQPGIISLAGGLPSSQAFPVAALTEAIARVMRDTPQQALQYAASEGFGPLREWVTEHLAAQGVHASPAQVLITTGSQQGLDLVGKVLIDAGSRVAVESPTYLGALQAFAPYEPRFEGLDSDEQGPLPQAVRDARTARFAYLLPNFQNPSGHCLSEARREALVHAAADVGLPLVEDNPYGDLWYDDAPPAPLAARWPQGTVYLGSFSKVLAPGLRLGYTVAPAPLVAKLLQAKQASDLHTAGLNQRVAFELIRDGFLRDHVPVVRRLYKARRDAMEAALRTHLPDLARWTTPSGGMFFWLELREGMDATALLPRAIEAGVAYVPGAAFYADRARPNTLRLSFVTVPPEDIERGVAALARVLRTPADARSAA